MITGDELVKRASARLQDRLMNEDLVTIQVDQFEVTYAPKWSTRLSRQYWGLVSIVRTVKKQS